MEISCDIIKDILPLYAEDMVSNATREMVDEHLCKCDDCTKELASLKKAQAVPVDVEITSLKRIGDTLRRRRVLTVLAVMMTAVAFIVTGFTYMLTPYILTADEAIEGVDLREDGGLAIDYARGVNGMAGRGIFDVDNYGHLCHTNRYDWYQAKRLDKQIADMNREELEAYICELYKVEKCTQRDWDRFFQIHVDYGVYETADGEHYTPPYQMGEKEGKLISHPADRNHWYLDSTTGDVEKMMWDGGKDMPTSIIWTPGNGYAYVLWTCLILGVFCCVISRGITGIWKEVLSRVTILLFSIVVSVLLVTGGQLSVVEYYLTHEWTEAIYLESLVLCLSGLLWFQLWKLKRQLKGV